VDAIRIICLIRMFGVLVGSELFKAGKSAATFFALPLL